MKKIFSLIAAVLFAGSMMAESLLSIDFTQGQGEWTINNVELGGLEAVWSQTSQYGMKATGYQDGNHATEAWLVSPAFDLTGSEVATLAFSHARKYGDLSQLSVLAKAGEGEWTALEVSAWPDGSSWSFIEATADLSAFAGQAAVQVAFKYTSTTDGGATWEIKTVSITNEGVVPPPAEDADVVFLPADFAGQGVEQTGGEVSATKDGVTVSSNKAFGHNLALRCYKNGSLSVVSSGEQIGKIEFQFYSTYNGGLSETVVVNAQEWSVESLSAQARIEKLKVYFGEAEPVVGPTYDTITVAQALEIGKALQVSDKNNKYPSEKSYVIKGYTCAIEAMFDETYKNESFWVSDTKGERTKDNAVAFEVYRGKPNTEKEVGLDALVQFKCQILNFSGTIENYDGNPAVEVLEQGVPLTVYSPAAQELTVSMRDNDWLDRLEEVYLLDNKTGARIDLLMQDYTFDAEAGTTEGRFILFGVFKAPQGTTDIENGEVGDGKQVRKLLINDKLYIIRNGMMYDATGKQVKK